MRKQLTLVLYCAGVCAVAMPGTAKAQPAGNAAPAPTTEVTSPNQTPSALPTSGPSQTPPPTSQNPSAAPANQTGGQVSRTDQQLNRKTSAALKEAFPVVPGVNGAPSTGGTETIKVATQNGKVTLSGTVSSQAQKDAVQAKAAAAAGGESNVVNELIVQ